MGGGQIIKLFRGAKAPDLAGRAAKFDLVVNLQAAKAIGHEVPVGRESAANGCIWHEPAERRCPLHGSFGPQAVEAGLKSRSAAVSWRAEVCYLSVGSTGATAVRRREFITLLGSYTNPMSAAETTAFVHKQQQTWQPILDEIAKNQR